MPLETGDKISDLNPLWPVGADDSVGQGDDHLRLIKTVLTNIFPIGAIYTTATNTNPGTFIGFTWEAFAPGRTLVGAGNNGESNWTGGLERGSETHTLEETEIPAHSHTTATHNGTTGQNGAHNHRSENGGNFWVDTASGNIISISPGGATPQLLNVTFTDTEPDHNHSFTVPGQTTSEVGAGAAHDNIQPSLGVYYWRRTA